MPEDLRWEYPDASVEKLARLYREHPAWCAAAAIVDSRASSSVWFSHRPGEPWRLRRDGNLTILEPGRAPDPDLVFRFTPAAIDALAESGHEIGDFAIRLFELMIDPDETRHVGFRAAASLPRLLHRGYLRLLIEGGGARVAAFAAGHGVRNLRGVRKLVDGLARLGPFDWEVDAEN